MNNPDELAGLTEPVQAAMRTMEGSAGGDRDDAYDVIRGELLRLAREVAELRGKNADWAIDYSLLDDRLTQRAIHAEAELAALKRRIAEAFVVDLHRGCYGWYEMYDPATQDLADIPETIKGQRVALLPVGGE